jgi:ABC-2 type transport system ATP-binding protein
MILDIIKPDAGRISVLGGALTEATKERNGYLPEERGLYHDMTVLDTLLFLGQLKGLSRATARERADDLSAPGGAVGRPRRKDPGP